MGEFKNGDLMVLEAVLRPCKGKGNIPTQFGTMHNLQNLENALRPVRVLIDEDPAMKYHAQNVELAREAGAFDRARYDEGAVLARSEEHGVAPTGMDSLEYFRSKERIIDRISEFDEEMYAVGQTKIEELMAQPNGAFAPYRYNLDKLSEDLGNERLNAGIVAALVAFGQMEDGT